MSYARNDGVESDVYVYADALFGGELITCTCGESGRALTRPQMVQHLISHLKRGEKVPQRAFDRLAEEIQEEKEKGKMVIEMFGKEYVVEFAHDSVDKWTTASLYELVDGKSASEPLAVGEAFCNVKDTFSRTTGRKVAFAKMLDIAQKRLFKQEMWVKYFEKHPKDKSK